MTIDNQTRSLHYFHTYAVRDRVDMGNFCDDTQLPATSDIDLWNLLPTRCDDSTMRENMAILVGRILAKYMPFFSDWCKDLPRHLPHNFSCEMSQKSEVVPLGIILKGEQKYEEMIEVLTHLSKYVPTVTTTETVPVAGEEPVKVTQDSFHTIALGGDQMTVARTRGCKRIRSNAERGKERLEGFTALVEDWHAKVAFLGVIWKRLYNASSGMDGGTLHQLRNIINRRNVTKDPSGNATASEEFFLLVTEAHILTAAMTVFQMTSLEDTPTSPPFTQSSSDLSSSEQTEVVLHAVTDLLDQFVDLTFCQPEASPSDAEDRIHAYACEVITLGLLLIDFNDAVREGDGTRIIRLWRYLLLYKASNRSNYAIEAFTLLAQFDFLLPHRLARQLAWSRTINTHGHAGKNVACDLHMEHLNREAKKQITGLGSNITDAAVTRIGKALGDVVQIVHQFDLASAIKELSSRHSKKSCKKDMEIILKQLHKTSKVFEKVPGRAHHTFPNLERNCMNSLDTSKLSQWMKEQLRRKLIYH